MSALAPTAHAELDGLPEPRRSLAITSVLAAMVLVVLDAAIANVALLPPLMSASSTSVDMLRCRGRCGAVRRTAQMRHPHARKAAPRAWASYRCAGGG